jgi:anti-sigma regulatory factor (Ser/Thr protein kinase)
MTSPLSRRVDAVPGSLQAAHDLEPSSGVGPAIGLDASTPFPRLLRSYLELGALPTAVPCARLHARHLLWEWGMTGLAATAELLVSELVTNAVKATAEHGDQAAVRLRLSGDVTRVLIEVWDADSRPPAPKAHGEDGAPDPMEEGGLGLFLVAALSARWDWYLTQEPAGKVVWCEIKALSPTAEPRRSRSWLPGRIANGQAYEPVEQRRRVRHAYRRPNKRRGTAELIGRQARHPNTPSGQRKPDWHSSASGGYFKGANETTGRTQGVVRPPAVRVGPGPDHSRRMGGSGDRGGGSHRGGLCRPACSLAGIDRGGGAARHHVPQGHLAGRSCRVGRVQGHPGRW